MYENYITRLYNYKQIQKKYTINFFVQLKFLAKNQKVIYYKNLVK